MTRYRDLGLSVGLLSPGPMNAITDVPGVRVGVTTLIEGDGPLEVGTGPIRTGVTAILPHEGIGEEPLFAGCHTLNGNGELTGLEWVRESGLLTRTASASSATPSSPTGCGTARKVRRSGASLWSARRTTVR